MDASLQDVLYLHCIDGQSKNNEHIIDSKMLQVVTIQSSQFTFSSSLR